MLRSDIVAYLEECCEMDHETADDVLEVVFGLIIERLHENEEVNIMGFGKFSPSVRKAHMGRNPKTGEAVMVPEKRTLKFTPGSSLKRALSLDPTDTSDD